MQNKTHLSDRSFSKLQPSNQILFNELSESIREMLVVPNSCLPVEFRDKVRGGRTLQRLDQMTAKRDGLSTKHQILKAAKARNVERLAAQVAAGATDIDAPLDYSGNEIDALALYRAECALIGGMVNGGLIDAEDLLED